MRRTLMALAGLLAVLLPACGSSESLEGGGEAGTIVVGSADFAENELLMQIYAEALRGTGAQVRTQPRVGAREVVVPALQDGSLTVIPEYTGNLLYFLDKQATATRPEEVNTALRQAVQARGGLEVLEPSPAQDSDVLVVTRQTADQLGLRSMADLGPRCGQLVLGASSEWRERWTAKIQQLYGCTFADIRVLDTAGTVTIESLRNGDVQVANLFTTASAIEQNGFVELADPQQMYPAQNVIPLARQGSLTPPQRDVLNQISAALTTDQLTELNRRVEVDKVPSPDVAKQFLAEAGIPTAG